MKTDTWGKKPKKAKGKSAWGGKPKGGRKKDKFISPKFGKPPKPSKSDWGKKEPGAKTAAGRKARRNPFGRFFKRPSQLTLRDYYNRVSEFGKPREERIKAYNERLGVDAQNPETRATALRDAADVAVMEADLRAQGLPEDQIRVRKMDLLRELELTRPTRARVAGGLREVADLGRLVTGKPLSPEGEAAIAAAQGRFGKNIDELQNLVRVVTGKPLSPAQQNNVQRWVDEQKQKLSAQFAEVKELADVVLALFRG